MSEKRIYELTDDEYAAILEASRPVPYIVFGGVEPISPQQRANTAWQALGNARGFDWRTVTAGPDARHFYAVSVVGEQPK